MDESTVLTLLPASTHGGTLFLSYSSSNPEFVASTLVVYDYKFHYVGIVISVYLIIFNLLKGVVLDPNGKDKGQLTAHILFLKTPALMLYPTFVELIDYCAGFMFADLPWLNNYFAAILSDPLDSAPSPYLLFYNSLSIASTYLLAVIFMVAMVLVLGVFAYLK